MTGAVQLVQDVKRFAGAFMVFRLKKGRNLSKRMGGQPLPWKHHETLELAEEEAMRLNREHPESTFVVMQTVSRIKVSTPLADAA